MLFRSVIDLTQYYASNQAKKVDLVFDINSRSKFDRTFGIFEVDNLNGDIVDSITGKTFKPGDAKWKDFAIQRSLNTQVELPYSVAGESGKIVTSLVSGKVYGTYLSETIEKRGTPSTIYDFSFNSANPANISNPFDSGENSFTYSSLSPLDPFASTQITLTSWR